MADSGAALNTLLTDAIVTACRDCILRCQGDGCYEDARLHIRAHVAMHNKDETIEVDIDENIDLAKASKDEKKLKPDGVAKQRMRCHGERKKGNPGSTLQWAKRIKAKHTKVIIDKLRGLRKRRMKDRDRGPLPEERKETVLPGNEAGRSLSNEPCDSNQAAMMNRNEECAKSSLNTRHSLIKSDNESGLIESKTVNECNEGTQEISQIKEGAISQVLKDDCLDSNLQDSPSYHLNTAYRDMDTSHESSSPNKENVSNNDIIHRKAHNSKRDTDGIASADHIMLCKKRRLVCDICHKCFTLRTNLTRHMRRMHRVSIETGQPITDASSLDKPITTTACSTNQSQDSSSIEKSSNSTIECSRDRNKVKDNKDPNEQDKDQNDQQTVMKKETVNIKSSCAQATDESMKIKNVSPDNRSGFDSLLAATGSKSREEESKDKKKPVQRRILPAPLPPTPSSQSQSSIGTGSNTHAQTSHDNILFFRSNTQPPMASVQPHLTSTNPMSPLFISPPVNQMPYAPPFVDLEDIGVKRSMSSLHVNQMDFVPPLSSISANEKRGREEEEKRLIVGVNGVQNYVKIDPAQLEKGTNQDRQAMMEYLSRASYTQQAFSAAHFNPMFTHPDPNHLNVPGIPAVPHPRGTTLNHSRSKSAEGYPISTQNESLNSCNSSTNTSIDVVNLSHETSSNLDQSALGRRLSNPLFPVTSSFGTRFSSDQNLSAQTHGIELSRIPSKSNSLGQLHSRSSGTLGTHFGSNQIGTIDAPSSLTRSDDNWYRESSLFDNHKLQKRPLSAQALPTSYDPPPQQEQPKILSTPKTKCSPRCAENEVGESSENEHGEPLSPLVPDELQDEPELGHQSTRSQNTSTNSGSHLKEALETVSKKLQHSAENLSILDPVETETNLDVVENKANLDSSMEVGELSPIVSPPSVHDDLDVDVDLEDKGVKGVKRSSSSHLKEALENVSKALNKNAELATLPTIDVQNTETVDKMDKIAAVKVKKENALQIDSTGDRNNVTVLEKPYSLKCQPERPSSVKSSRQASSLFAPHSSSPHDSFPTLGLYDLISPAKSASTLDHSTPVTMGSNMSSLFGVPPLSHVPIPTQTHSPGKTNLPSISTSKVSDRSTPSSPAAALSSPRALSSPLLNIPPPPPPYNAMLDSYAAAAAMGRFPPDMTSLSPFKGLSPLSPFKSPHHDFSKFTHDFSFMSPPKVSSIATSLMTPSRFYSNGFYPTLATSPHSMETGIPKVLSPVSQAVSDNVYCDIRSDSHSKSKTNPKGDTSNGAKKDHKTKLTPTDTETRPTSSDSTARATKSSSQVYEADAKVIRSNMKVTQSNAVAKGSTAAKSSSVMKSSAASGGDAAGKRRRHSCRAHRFDCTLCDAKFTFRTNLTRHMKKVHDTNPLQSAQEKAV